MKKILLIFAIVFSSLSYSQAITVSTNTYTVPQLVNTVLINSPCVSAVNVTSKTGTNFGSSNGIGFFQNTNPNFPMQSGVILSTGNVMHAAGPNTTELSDGNTTWPGDANLEATLASAGISMHSVNATVLEFDFTPISPTFSFDFLFASEEYGNFQCQFSDAFAFLLTNTSTGVTTNLAVVPNTNLPISVVTIRDFLYNSSCPSANAQYFGSYNGGSAAASSAVNFNGQTKLMNASATLVPNVTYHIKLVVADRSDESSDSAIFISSDTFNIGQDVLGQDITASSPNSPCFGDTYIINSNLNPANYTFVWTKNGVVLPSETGATLAVTESGTYGLTYQNIMTGCIPVSDAVEITYQPQIVPGTPINLYKCDTGATSYTYDLSANTNIVKAGLNPATIITYHATQALADSGSSALPLNYTAAPGTTIYVRIKNANNNCYTTESFQLLTSPAPVAHQPANMTKCAGSAFGNSAFNLTSQNGAILGAQPTSTYTVTYYSSLANANAATSALNANAFYATNNTTVYARVQNNSDSTCYSITSFVLYINPLPLVDSLDSVVLCGSYTLPHLNNGHFFSGPNGTGTPMFEGDVITETKTIYIYNESASGCSAGTSFSVTIIDPLTLAPAGGTYCGSYTLPGLTNGKYFTGDNGTGTQLQPGTVITTSQTIYVYFQSLIAPFCILTDSFHIVIVPGVTVETRPDVFECTSYTLPPLALGEYYTLPSAGGSQLPAGTILTTSQKVYIHALSSNNCASESSFNVVIGITAPADVDQCQPYILPALPVGKYFTGPMGTGTQIASGTAVSLTQTIYIYAPTTSGTNNCTDNLHFEVTIGQPIIDTLSDVSVCESYTLPALSSGDYYTGANGSGTMLHAGDVITSNQTIFIFKRATAICSNQSSFTVTVSPKPAIDSRSDIDICNSYVLTTLSVGNYYTGPNGTGTMLPGGTVITTSQLIYIYAVSPTAPYCAAQNSFNITIYSIEADAPTNVTACDRYTLPALHIGNYYSQPGGPLGGEGTLMHAGDVITTTKTIYVYTESGERINCTDENSFTITINPTPIVAPIANVNACHSYTLPALTVGNYFTAAGGTGTQLHANDVITINQTVYVYAQTATSPNCSDEKSFTINLYKVDVLPNVTTCDSYILPALTVGNYFTGASGTGTMLHAGQAVSSSKTIYIYGHAPFSPGCADESSFNVTIVNAPLVNAIPSGLTTVCDEDGINDGKTTFNLHQLDAAALGSQTGTEFTVTYYDNLADAESATNAITSTTASLVFVRVTNALTAHCYDLKSIVIKVNKLPEPTPVGGIICYDTRTKTLINPFTIQSGLSAATHTFEWTNESGTIVGTGATYTAGAPGNYTLVTTSNATGCASAPVTVTVSPSEPAIISYTMTDDFSDEQSITVTAQGSGDYEYQLDNGPFQDSNIFQNVSSGTHVITVHDKNGCGTSDSQALVINYPKYFTPNGDGYNDTWNIVDLKAKDNAIIHIFDRYGKLLGEIRPSGAGWDGMASGQSLPSTDYWFNVTYSEDGVAKEFRSHFAMKR